MSDEIGVDREIEPAHGDLHGKIMDARRFFLEMEFFDIFSPENCDLGSRSSCNDRESTKIRLISEIEQSKASFGNFSQNPNF